MSIGRAALMDSLTSVLEMERSDCTFLLSISDCSFGLLQDISAPGRGITKKEVELINVVPSRHEGSWGTSSCPMQKIKLEPGCTAFKCAIKSIVKEVLTWPES